MKVDIIEKGANEKQLELVLEKADYAPELNKKLKEARSKANMKGFRQGKTPMGMIKRMHGRQFALEIISAKVNEKLSEVIEEHKLDLINEPLLTSSSVPAIEGGELDADSSFTYILGLMPKIDTAGLSSDTTYDYYELQPDEKEVDERLEGMRKQMGENIQADDIQEKDNVEVEAVELDGDAPKEEGHTSTFRFAVDLVADEKLKEEILKLGNGDTFDFNIYNLEGDRNREYVQKYLMKIEDETIDAESIGDMFRATISSIHRQVPAELNEEFFSKGFPEHIKSAEDAKAEIANQYIKSYASVGDNLLIKDVISAIEETNPIELPENYIHQLLHSQGQHAHDDHNHDAELEDLRQSVKRQIIISMIIKNFGVEITNDDMRDKVMQEFTANFGGMTLPPETVDKIVTNAMQDEKYVRELSDRVLNEKVIAAVKGSVSLNVIKKSQDALMAQYDEAFPRKSEGEEE